MVVSLKSSDHELFAYLLRADIWVMKCLFAMVVFSALSKNTMPKGIQRRMISRITDTI